MSTSEPIPGGSDCLIKFASRADYNHFVAQLRSQLRSYLITSCLENAIEIGSPDYLTLESVLMDVSILPFLVFMKYTLEFLRENLLVGGRPLTPPAEFSTDPYRPVNGTDSGEQRSQKDGRNKVAKPAMTRPCDTALNERVIRQQYALCEADIENTRKRKDLPGHILQRVQAATDQSSNHLHAQTKLVDQLQAAHAQKLAIDPRQRWDVVNGTSISLRAILHPFL
ncbi:hypothetical protein VP01_1200g3 [Puccinia sorghi]|uniref:Uncharacterized protein n=1 Tax=Puccinia sorghi TaxID=27349 RepID=A0A0L6VQI3_9BASI|nr:hypothetical protein VP01_1200g3 [Puccinia sorghi]